MGPNSFPQFAAPVILQTCNSLWVTSEILSSWKKSNNPEEKINHPGSFLIAKLTVYPHRVAWRHRAAGTGLHTVSPTCCSQGLPWDRSCHGRQQAQRLVAWRQIWPQSNIVLSTAPINPVLLLLADLCPFHYLVMAQLTPWYIGQVVIVSTQGLSSLLKMQFNVNVFVIWHNVAQNNGHGHWAMPFQNINIDLGRNTHVCSQAEAIEKFFLKKGISNQLIRKMGGLMSFLQASVWSQRHTILIRNSWLERNNRNEEWFNRKQTVCAWDYQQTASLLSTSRVLAAWHCVSRDGS